MHVDIESTNPSLPLVLTRPRVVLAEDDREMRRVLADGLAEDGYEVVEVGSGLALFDELRRAHAGQVPMPSIIVSDIRMPGLTGLEVLRRIQAWHIKVPILMITAFGDEETLAAAREAGVMATFSKPFDVDDLRTAVLCLLTGRPTEPDWDEGPDEAAWLPMRRRVL